MALKPRLPSAPLTDDDTDIWNAVAWRGGFADCFVLEDCSFDSDRRDADLMFELVDLRSCGAFFNVRQLQTMAGQDGCGWVGRVYKWAGCPVAL
jgi:hypothetical protein